MNLKTDIRCDIARINQISSIPAMLNVICRTTGMRFAAVARVTDQQWITCLSKDEIDFGLKPGDELELHTTICNEIRQHKNPVVIDSVEENPDYFNHHTPKRYGFKSYISFPIFRKDGRFFGTLCAIDPEPAELKDRHIHELFQLYTQLISFHLESIEELDKTNRILLEEKKSAELRETFIAILGHDLRNPLSTTRLGADILLKMDIPEQAKNLVGNIKSSSLRMQELIDNLLDFAKAELGEGITLNLRTDNPQLEKEIEEVVNEIKAIDGDHEINLSIDLQDSVNVDINRIGQLFSNLLSNAVKHGFPSTPIEVSATTADSQFLLIVTNSADTIPEKKMKNLFKPFTTSSSENKKNGLGLGLYIASEIAKAHKGSIEVTSVKDKTSFKFIMPI